MRNRRLNALIGSLLAVCCISLVFAVVPMVPTASPAPVPSGEGVLASSGQGADDTSSAQGESQAAPTNDASADAMSDDGQFHMDPLASYEEGFVLAGLTSNVTADQAAQTIADETGIQPISVKVVTDDLVKVGLPEGVTVEDAVNALAPSSALVDVQPNYEYFPAEDVLSGVTGASESSGTAGADLVAGVSSMLQPQASLSLDVHPNDSYYVYSQGGRTRDYQSDYLDAIGLSSKQRAVCGWSKVTDASASNPVVVAVLDEGFDLTHEDFDASTFVVPYNAVTKTPGPNALSGYESHGTHVLSVLAAKTNNGIGIAGVTYNTCKAMPIKVADSYGKMYSEYLVEAYNYLINQKSANGENVRVVNLSVGDPRANNSFNTADKALYAKIKEANTAGILSVAAACNTDDRHPEVPFYAYPSDFDQVVSVIGLKAADKRYDPSNYNMPDQHAKNISAPAQCLSQANSTVGIITLGASDAGEDNYMQSSGTSMSAPMVSGVAALMFSTYPSMTPEQVTSKLYSTATDITTTGVGWDRETGYGRLNALAAMSEDTPYISGPTVVDAATMSPTTYSVLEGSAAASGYEFQLADSSDSTIATIRPSGTLTPTPTGAGEVTIVASKGNQRAYQTVMVYAAPESATIQGPDTVMAGTQISYSVSADPTLNWVWTIRAGTGASIDRNTGLLQPEKFAGEDRVVTIAASSGSGITIEKSVTIMRDDLSTENPHVKATVSSATYNGRSQSPTVVVQYDDQVLKQGTDYAIDDLPSKVDAGTYGFTISAVDSGPYYSDPTGQSSLSLDYTINKASINNASIRLSQTSFVYDGGAKAPAVTVYDIGNNASNKLVYGTDYTLQTSPATLGTGSVVVKAAPGCKNFNDKASPRYFTVSAQRVSMFRLYNPYSGEHFYTASASERDHLRSVGWNYEGLGWTAPHLSTAPVYRMYNAYAGDHHYTPSASERDSLVRAGWRYEGIGWYSDTQRTTPLYREYNPNAEAGSHNYTTSLSEHRFLCSVGWRDEGIGWYGL